MLIQITNTCRMGCKHCLNDSKQYDSHMTSMTWNKVLNHAKSSGVNVMLISGGEPTEHPYWNEIIDEACDNFTDVVIPTNGMWINTDKEDLMLMILKKHPNCQVQITSVRGYYPLYDKIVTSVRELKQRLKVHPDRDEIQQKASEWRPCGKCRDYQKLLNNKQPKYLSAKAILGIQE